MKNFLISEIIYWVIAVISLFSVFENWTINSDRAYIFLGFVYYLFLWLYLEDILEKSIQKKVNDNFISLLLSAFFSGMEIAYVSSNRLNLEIEKNQSGLIPKVLSIITQNPSRFIATMLIGNNFALVIYGIFMGQFIIDNIPFIDLRLDQ